MKVLLDTCVWGGVKTQLEAAGYDVVWIGDWDKDPGDEEILSSANQEGRVIVTSSPSHLSPGHPSSSLRSNSSGVPSL